jgi:hypothetical protein
MTTEALFIPRFIKNWLVYIFSLLPVIKEKIHFPWSPKSLGRVVKIMGFK